VRPEAPACFGCGGRFEPAQLEEVGDTVFCAACLGRMLRRVDERGARIAGKHDANGVTGAMGASLAGRAFAMNGANAANDANVANDAHAAHGAGGAAVANLPPADAPCFLCGEPLEGRAFVELRGFAICASCSRGLVGAGSPAAEASGAGALVIDDDRPVAGDDAADDDPSRRAAPPAHRGQRIETPGTATEWCSGCGRAMPGPGSYRLVDGRPHCAACVAARPSQPPRPQPSVEAPAAALEDTCDACRRPAAPGALSEARGFRLCVACLDTDPALALALAQARHRQQLERAARRILAGGEDD
jgi:hypothetical protein